MRISASLQNIFLYTVCTLIWGSTWFAITWQVDSASAVASVFWRFLIAFVVLLGLCVLAKQKMSWSPRQHLLFAGQGILMFSVNYMLTYIAETMISSGLVALSFTVLIYYNIAGMRLFFGKPITAKVIWGSACGGLGIALIFLQEILHFDPQSKTIVGLAVGFVATLSASMGNMIAQKNYALKVPVMVTNTYGMLYGSLFTLAVGLLARVDLSIPLNLRFLSALLYLSIFGTVIAFGAYLLLAGRIGAEKAGYTSVVSPVIALTISSFFEAFEWTPFIIAGVLLCLLGNVLTLLKTTKV